MKTKNKGINPEVRRIGKIIFLACLALILGFFGAFVFYLLYEYMGWTW